MLPRHHNEIPYLIIIFRNIFCGIMAPPLVPKRALSSDPPDARNRVSKLKPIASKGSISSSASRSPLKTVEASRKEKAIEKALNLIQCFTDDHHKDVDEVINGGISEQLNRPKLMKDINGLIDLTNNYLQDLEKKHPGVGADFLALLADGTSRAIRSQRVNTPPLAKAKEQYELREKTWAQRAACHDPE
ncbi:hypothetical protein K3495_g2392 [Podosphaera aphanis]|nr:hypothetical protein K3495_g2392 [Podosphaera aphanis]